MSLVYNESSSIIIWAACRHKLSKSHKVGGFDEIPGFRRLRHDTGNMPPAIAGMSLAETSTAFML
jgi:hypothetical protein